MSSIRSWAIGWGVVVVMAALAPAGRAAAGELLEELKKVPYQIIYETYRENNWELFRVDADGSNPVNLTRTPTIDEMYPHASRDGTRVCFVVDEGEGDAKARNVYFMNLDGSSRTLVARGAREPFWSADGRGIVYLKGEFEKYTPLDYATKGIFVYDLASRTHTQHANQDIHHLYNICSTPDGKWYLATVHAGMGYGHAILAVEAHGTRVINLKIPGCRPDVSPDGKHVVWGANDYALRIGDLDFSGPEPKVVNAHDAVTSAKPIEVYHVDWSPDGKYLAFSRGPHGKTLKFAPEMIGIRAEGWNICVADAGRKDRWVAITNDGNSNKEPHWIPRAKDQR